LYNVLGANDGESIRSFLFKTIDSNTKKAHLAGDGSMDSSIILSELLKDKSHELDHKGWDLYSFEANSKYRGALERQRKSLMKEYPLLVKSYNLYNGVAISTYDGNVTFTLDAGDGFAGLICTSPPYYQNYILNLSV
jgi:hypothetical protein